MPIGVKCECGHKFAAPDNLAGKRVKCPGCQNAVRVPEAEGGGAASSGKPFAVKCACGKSIAAKPEWGGKSVKCPGCGQPMKIPAVGAAPAKAGAASAPARKGAAKPSPSSPGSGSIVANLLDEVGVETSRTGARCPGCRADIDPEAVLCVECGYHLGKGKRLETIKATQRLEKKIPGLHSDAKSGGKPGASSSAKEVPGEVASAATYLQQLAYLNIFVAVLLGAFGVYIMFDTSQKGGGNSDVDAGVVMAQVVISCAITAVFAGLLLTSAQLVRKGSRGGWILGMVMSGLLLLNFPIGTIISLVVFKKLLSAETRQWCS